MTTPRDPAAPGPVVVVGVDGSAAGTHALRWALRFAAAYDGSVVVVTAWPLPTQGPVVGADAARRRAARTQARVVGMVVGAEPCAVPVATRLVHGPAGNALAEAAVGSAVLVIGAAERRVGTAAGVTLAEDLQRRATCPVLEVSASGAVALPWGQHAFSSATGAVRASVVPTPG